MKLLFVHDHVFCKSREGDIYSPGGFPRELWNKYTFISEELTVIGRCSSSEDELSKKHVLSSYAHDPISFVFVKSISNPLKLLKNRNSTFAKIENTVKQVDVVIARLPSENGLAAIEYAKKHNKPYSIEVVGCVWDGLYNYGSMIAKLYAPVAYTRMRKAISSANNVLYVTNIFLQKRYPNTTAENIVNASNVNINITSNKPESYGYKTPIVIGMIGNYKTNYKGIDTALKAMLILHRKKFNFEFRVLGNGNPNDYKEFICKNNLSGTVKFYEPLPSGEPVLNWIRDVDIYIQPSRQEGLPRSLIEALSCGRVCIGSQAGGIPELLNRDFIHITNSPKSLANKIIFAFKLSETKKLAVLKENIENIQQYDSELLKEKRDGFYNKLKEHTLK